MDRIALFAMGAAFVLASALHMIAAPIWLVAVPVALFVAGAVHLLVSRARGDTGSELSRSTATEA